MTEPWVGAWVWASGSHVWNGNIGTLMANPMNIPANTRLAVAREMSSAPDCCKASMSKVWGSDRK